MGAFGGFVAGGRLFGRLAVLLAFAGAAPVTASAQTPDQLHTYYTGGVHNDKDCLPPSKCVYARKKGEPTDPLFPEWWTSAWTMYRVFTNYDKYPPPYDNPPKGLTAADYQVSYGASYYDSTYAPADKDGSGAMMEHYEEYCLPIFPMPNKYSCSFVSLGNKAYFLTYADRPQNMPACCQFSLHNHPPARDFIKHLPYNKRESGHLGGTVQAYSMRPGGILFGYAFYKQPTADAPGATPYRHPQSFYFAGYPVPPPQGPNAPIVSQNYTGFSAEKPDPAKTWEQVAQMCPANPGWCCLFETDCPSAQPTAQASPIKERPSWSTIKR